MDLSRKSFSFFEGPGSIEVRGPVLHDPQHPAQGTGDGKGGTAVIPVGTIGKGPSAALPDGDGGEALVVFPVRIERLGGGAEGLQIGGAGSLINLEEFLRGESD